MELIKKFLEEKLKIQGWQLCMATPIMEILGTVTEDDTTNLEKAFLSYERIPPEIRAGGMVSIANYLSQLGYDTAKEFILEVCATLR